MNSSIDEVFGAQVYQTYLNWENKNTKLPEYIHTEDGYKVFGTKEYQTYLNWEVENIKLPENIHTEMVNLFKFSVANNLNALPIAVLMDPRLSLKKIEELVKEKQFSLSQTKTSYTHINDAIFKNEEQPDLSTKKPYWVIMTDVVIGRMHTYDQQQQIVTQNGYDIPTLTETVTYIYLKQISSENSNSFQTPYTSARTPSTYQGWGVAVGRLGFSIQAGSVDENIGVCALKRF